MAARQGKPTKGGANRGGSGFKLKSIKFSLTHAKKIKPKAGDRDVKRDASFTTPQKSRHGGVKFMGQKWNGNTGDGKATRILNGFR